MEFTFETTYNQKFLAVNSLRSGVLFRAKNIVTWFAILAIFFVFIYSANHAQVYDKNSMSGGTAEEFCRFIEEKTGKKV